jgi:uncharacterized protein (UPF0262 family)
MCEAPAPASGRLIRVVLDGQALHRLSPLQEADRAQAVIDLETENSFSVVQAPLPQSILHLSIQEGRLVFDIRNAEDQPVLALGLAMGPFKMLIKDYQMLLDSYAGAIAEGREAKIQAIDMGRRGLHNEGATLMQARLEGKVKIDFDTARRLFTLLCALQQKL